MSTGIWRRNRSCLSPEMRRISSGIKTGRPIDENVIEDAVVVLLLWETLFDAPDVADPLVLDVPTVEDVE